MIVREIAVSVPNFENTGCKTADELIAYCARVSNPANQNNSESAPKLIKYLMNNAHWSPFEMVSMTLEIVTTRDIARQILRHRSFSFQEFSQRYAKVVGDPTIREARLQDAKNRQNSVETEDDRLEAIWRNNQLAVWNSAIDAYQEALDMGIAKEVARAVLPEGLTPSTLYMAGTLRSWIHYCDLRMGNGTQKEHKLVAEKAWEVINDRFPSLSLFKG